MGHKIRLLVLIISALLISNVGEANAEPELFDIGKAYFYNFYGICGGEGGIWLVGSHGMICRYDKGRGRYEVEKSGFLGNLYDVVFEGKRGWIVGQNGLILHTSDGGKTWKRQKSGTKEHLFGVVMKGDEGWVIGAFGTLLHTKDGGKSWKQGYKKIDRIYNGISFINEREGWIVGEFGSILHTGDGGESWEEQKSPLGETTLFSVYFEDSQRGWITGMDGKILRTLDGGKKWELVKSPVKEHLFSIVVRGDRGWAVGLKGVYARYDGKEWRDETKKIPVRAWLKKCYFSDDDHGWIVGSVGTLLKSEDGGKTWKSGWE